MNTSLKIKFTQDDFLQYLQKNLSPERLEHTLNVAALSCAVAEELGEDVDKARTAGLLHDATKEKPNVWQIEFCKGGQGIDYFDEIVARAPHLLHSYTARIFARQEFNIDDSEILNAIADHTLGGTNMSLLSKIIYVADAISIDRGASAEHIREIVFNDFDKAFIETMKYKISYVLACQKWLCKKCIEVWNFYV